MAYLFWLVTSSTDVTREANIPPSSARIKADMSDYRSPRHHTALRSAGAGNLPSKVTVSPAASWRAQTKTKSSECLHGLIQRPPKTKIAIDFNPFTSDQAHNHPAHAFDLIYIFICQLLYLTASTAPYRTAQLGIYMVFTSRRGDNTAQRGLFSFTYAESPGISILLWENSSPNSAFRAESNIWVCPSRLSLLLFAKWQHQTGTKDQTQVLSTAAVGS